MKCDEEHRDVWLPFTKFQLTWYICWKQHFLKKKTLKTALVCLWFAHKAATFFDGAPSIQDKQIKVSEPSKKRIQHARLPVQTKACVNREPVQFASKRRSKTKYLCRINY
jgi:hypothetical protein